MIRSSRVWLFVFFAALCCSAAHGFTLTFDDIPTGDGLSYYTNTCGVLFSHGFLVSDRTQYDWGLAHSGSNALAFYGVASQEADIAFQGNGNSGQVGTILPYSVSSISGYFSTDLGAVVTMTAYHGSLDNPVAQATIGYPDPDVSWNNHYLELSSTQGIDFIEFTGLGSPDARLGFCVDDLTITSVPEPSAFLAMFVGLAGLPLYRIRKVRCH